MILTQRFCDTYPKAHAGLLVMRNAQNPEVHPELEQYKRKVEEELRVRYANVEQQKLEKLPPLSVYDAYYRRYDKTYHVAGQLKSVVYKNKPIPSVAALVEAMFIAELKNGLLTAGHDLDQVELPIRLDAADGSEHFIVMRGADQALKPGDMYIADEKGALSSILYGPDQRTQITPNTRNVLFTVYAPEGVDPAVVEEHLKDIENLVKWISPGATTETLIVFGVE